MAARLHGPRKQQVELDLLRRHRQAVAEEELWVGREREGGRKAGSTVKKIVSIQGGHVDLKDLLTLKKQDLNRLQNTCKLILQQSVS